MVTPTDLRRLRGESRSLVELAKRDLAGLLRTADEQAIEALGDVLPSLIESYGLAAATVAADWYDDVRDASTARGRFTAVPVDIPDSGVWPLIGWATWTATDDAGLLGLLQGGTQRRILNWARGTITGSSVLDPAADGWQRAASPGACNFCLTLAGRGAVYSEATVDFGPHDDCNCTAVPAFGGEPRPVEPFEPSERYIGDENRKQTDQARAREWMREHGQF